MAMILFDILLIFKKKRLTYPLTMILNVFRDNIIDIREKAYYIS